MKFNLYCIPLIAVIVIVCIPTASAMLPYKEYNNASKTVTVYDWFGLDKVAEIKLETPQIFQVMAGKNRKVFEITINLDNAEYKDFLEKIELINNQNGKAIDREITYKYKYYAGQKDVPNYIDNCKTITEANGTKFEQCNSIVDGFHKEDIYDWMSLEKLDLQKGIITIGGFTDVYNGDNIEWIPTIFGVKVDEWATWTSSFNTGLNAYWKLNETSGNAIDSLGTYNGTLTSMTQGLTGIIGNAYNSTATTSKINVGNLPIGTLPFTFNVWIYAHSANSYPLGRTACGGGLDFNLVGGEMIVGKCGVNQISQAFTENLGKWQMYTIVYNRTTVIYYQNGSQIGTDIYASDFLAETYTIGNNHDVNKGGHGLFDEIGLWNRSLSTTEVSDLWNNGAGLTYTDKFPSITAEQNYPINNSNYSSNIVIFSCNATTTVDSVANMTLYIYNGGTTTNYTDGLTGATNSTTWTVIKPDGQYNWTCLAGSASGLSSWASGNYSLNIDSVAPTIAITYPVANVNYSSNTSILNYTYSDLHIGKCNMSVSVGTANSSVVTGGNNYSGIISAEGSNTWNLQCNDSFGNIQTSSVTFFKDTVKPLISYGANSDADGIFVKRDNLYINTTWTEANFKSISFALWGTSSSTVTYTTATYFHNFTSLSEGLYYYNVTITDRADNYNQTATRNITIDSTSPTIAIVYPENDSYNSNVSTLNYTIIDANPSTCWYSRDLGDTNETAVAAGDNFTDVISAEGGNTLTLYCNDSAGNLNTTAVTFFKDTVFPLISYEGGTLPTGTFIDASNIYINTTWTEANFKSISFALWGTSSSTVTYTTATYKHNFTSLSDGLYYYNVTVTDIADNYNQTLTRNITLDSTSPSISIVYPDYPTGIYYYKNVSTFNYTIIDANPSKCWYSSDNGLTNSTVVAAGTNFTGLVLLDGQNRLRLYCNDSAGNLNTTNTSFWKDTFVPNIVFMADVPVNNTFQSSNLFPNNLSITEKSGISFTGINYSFYHMYSTLYNSTTEISYKSHASTLDAISQLNISLLFDPIPFDGTYYYNSSICDWSGNCNETEIRTITFDSISPVITIVSPTGDEGLHVSPYNVTLNYTASDIHLQSCWYNSTINPTINYTTCNTTQIISVVNVGLNTVYVYANDTSGNINFSFINFYTPIIDNGVTYTSPIISGDLTFILGNFTFMVPLTNELVTYNNTNFSSNVLISGNQYILVDSIIAPNVLTSTNVSFFYIFVTNNTQYITSLRNQTINNLVVSTDCSSGFYILNITSFDEVLLSSINGTVEYDISVMNNNIEINHANGSSSGTNISLCSNIDLSTSIATLNVQLRYYGDGYMYETYNIKNGNSSLTPFVVDLYFLNSSVGTQFLINYVDFNYLLHPGAIIQIQRQYLPDNSYKIVEIPIISSIGQSQGSFDTHNIRYKLVVVDGGKIIDIFNDIFPVCQNAILGTCTINLRGAQGLPTGTVGDFTYSLNVTNHTITLTYVIPSGTPKSVTFLTAQNSRFLGNITTCNTTIFASGGTIICGYNDTVGDSVVELEIDVPGQLPLYGTVSIPENLSNFFLLNNYVIAFFLLLTLVLMFISSAMAMLVIGVVGLIYLGLIFLIRGGGIGIVATSIIWLIIAIGLAVYKISQKEEKT